jgi:hypothetical protein
MPNFRNKSPPFVFLVFLVFLFLFRVFIYILSKIEFNTKTVR